MALVKQLRSWLTWLRPSERRDALPSTAILSLTANRGPRIPVSNADADADSDTSLRDLQRQLADAKAPIRWHGDPRDIYLA